LGEHVNRFLKSEQLTTLKPQECVIVDFRKFGKLNLIQEKNLIIHNRIEVPAHFNAFEIWIVEYKRKPAEGNSNIIVHKWNKPTRKYTTTSPPPLKLVEETEIVSNNYNKE
jgi:hypothetical protein